MAESERHRERDFLNGGESVIEGEGEKEREKERERERKRERERERVRETS